MEINLPNPSAKDNGAMFADFLKEGIMTQERYTQ